MEEWKRKAEKWKYPILMAVLGVLLMLLPGTGKTPQRDTAAEALTQVLSQTQGVGRCKVICSEQGVVVVCDGANSAEARLAILGEVKAYTGFSSDRISVQKMTQ